MLVGARMTQPVITVKPNLPIQEALILMKRERIRRLPVVDKKGDLVAIVSESDLLHASPSDATSLSVFELNYLLSKITISEIMNSDVVTITEDTPIEVAARIMADNKIGGLPVLRDGKVVGIITETDLFKVFLEIFGAREYGVRLTVLVPNSPGKLAKLTRTIFDNGGNILALGTFMGESSQNHEVALKVSGIKLNELKKIVMPHVDQLVDIREGD